MQYFTEDPCVKISALHIIVTWSDKTSLIAQDTHRWLNFFVTNAKLLE